MLLLLFLSSIGVSETTDFVRRSLRTSRGEGRLIDCVDWWLFLTYFYISCTTLRISSFGCKLSAEDERPTKVIRISYQVLFFGELITELIVSHELVQLG